MVTRLIARLDDWRNDTSTVLMVAEQPVSRQEFAELACRMAHQLTAAGLRQGDLVAVRPGTGWQWIAVLLGIWRAGGVFLPQTALRPGRHDPRPRMTVDCMASREPALVGTTDPDPARVAADTAYLLPTSGSTGRPKWIQGTLHGLDHFVSWEVEQLQVRPDDVFAHLTAPTFDPVLREVLVPLVAGACLAVPADRSELVRSLAAVGWLERAGVTVAHTVPTLARLWCSGNAQAVLSRLRALLLAGEPLYERDLRSWAERFGTGAVLYNLYGPSETTLAKCAQRIDLTRIDDAVFEGKVAVGAPLPQAGVLVADGDRVCAPYEVGEILIRTPHTSHGYWNLPEADAERFVRNPFVAEDPLPIFRTRDLGYQLPDGRLVVEGRLDGEYKFRGIRVDLGRIEDAIRQVPGVQDAGVKVVTPATGPAILAAFVVSEYPTEEIAAQLPETLDGPRPVLWTAVAELPRTRSGKLDRNALPEPAAASEGETVGDATPGGDPLVAALLGIWREVIPHNPAPGPHSSFTATGGQSIEAVQVLNRIEDEFGLSLHIRDLFDLQTPYLLAARIRSSGGGTVHDNSGTPQAAHNRLGRIQATGPLPLTGAQERFWDWIENDRDPARFQFLWAARLTGPVDIQRLADAADTVLQAADGQWITISRSATGPRQSLLEPRPTVEVVTCDPDSEPLAWCRADAERLAARPFVFGDEPLMRVRIYPLGPDETVLVLVNHVLASDGWTKEQYLRQVSSVYAGEKPPDGLEFAAYAAWEAEQRAGWPAASDHWDTRLRELTTMRLPWRSAPDGAGASASHVLNTVSWSMSTADSHALRTACTAAGITVPAALASALVRALQEWTGQQEGQLLLSNAKRPDPRLNTTLGCFTDSAVLPYYALPNEPAAAARTVGDQIGTALRLAQPSFLWLLRTHRPDLDPHAPVTFPVIFAPQPDFAPAVELPGVRAAALSWGEPRWIWPLEVYPVITGPEIHFHLNYATEYLDIDRVRQLAALLRAQLARLQAPADSERLS